MAEFADNNSKIASTSHTSFKFNCDYHSWMSYKEEVKLCFQSKSADKLLVELRELMIICWENLYHAQEFQERAHNKGVKPQSYAYGEKIWLNNK